MPAESTPRKGFGLLFWLAVVWVAVVVFFAVFADVLPLRDPNALGIRTREVARYEGPGFNALFGGDGQGRDQFARVVAGARPALLLGFVATSLATVIGTLIGVTSGYLRGRIDTIVSGIIDITLAFPALVLLIAVRSSLGASLTVFIAIFTITSIPTYARIVRGATLSLAEREFVDAARSMGATHSRVVLKELIPNIALPVLSFAFIGFAIVILTEGGLAFLGLSLDRPTWGTLISEGNSIIEDHPHLSLIPATVMFLTILAFNLVGDGLRTLFASREVATQRKLVVLDQLPPTSQDYDAVLSITDLHTTIITPNGAVYAVNAVTVAVDAGQALGIVGESGSGKTMLLRSIVGAFPSAEVRRSGRVNVCDVDMIRGEGAAIRRTLGSRIGMISQNPLSALNPTRRIDTQIMEPMLVHGGLTRVAARDRALDLMRQVGIPAPEQRLREYPHQLSGGMCQRVTIAIALANDPQLLLADEPTTALDVTVQSQILDLLARVRRERSMAMVLVTHDLAVVKGCTDHLAIMYAGEVVEFGPTESVFAHPAHRYTLALMHSMPDLRQPSHTPLATIEGVPPSLLEFVPGCRFASRCDAATDKCREESPPETITAGHRFRCWHPAEQPVEVNHGR